jgi:RNase P/RNase MRP subunit POP5
MFLFAYIYERRNLWYTLMRIILSLHGSYLFAEIGRRVTKFKNENTNADIIRLGIGVRYTISS